MWRYNSFRHHEYDQGWHKTQVLSLAQPSGFNGFYEVGFFLFIFFFRGGGGGYGFYMGF